MFLPSTTLTFLTSSKTLPLVKYPVRVSEFETICGVAPAYDHSRRYRRRWLPVLEWRWRRPRIGRGVAIPVMFTYVATSTVLAVVSSDEAFDTSSIGCDAALIWNFVVKRAASATLAYDGTESLRRHRW